MRRLRLLWLWVPATWDARHDIKLAISSRYRTLRLDLYWAE